MSMGHGHAVVVIAVDEWIIFFRSAHALFQESGLVNHCLGSTRKLHKTCHFSQVSPALKGDPMQPGSFAGAHTLELCGQGHLQELHHLKGP